MIPEIEIQLIAFFIAIACSLPGVFLVLRKMSMMADAITHTILLGIVIGFFITKDLSSPLLILGAGIAGTFTVYLTETLYNTGLVSKDSAIGISYPLLFSIAVILISRNADSVHLDTDSVLLGELAFAPFNRLEIKGIDIGAKGIYVAGSLMVINILFVVIFFKELKISAFDPILAPILGFSPVVIHYALMTIVSITAVGAFETAGSTLAIAFMIGPPATAYMLTGNLKTMIILSGVLGGLSGIIGYQTARIFDVSIAGTIALTIGIIFMSAFVFRAKKELFRSNKNFNSHHKQS